MMIDPGQLQMPKPRGGMFGGGGDWKQALAAALSAMSAARGNPIGMAGIQMLNQRLGQKREDQQYEQRRQAELQDYGKKLEMQAQYGKPPQPHYFEDNSGNLMAIGPDGKPQMVYEDPNPFKLVPNGMGGVIPVNMQELMKGVGKPAAPGVTFTPIEEGGPAATPPATFPFRF